MNRKLLKSPKVWTKVHLAAANESFMLQTNFMRHVWIVNNEFTLMQSEMCRDWKDVDLSISEAACLVSTHGRSGAACSCESNDSTNQKMQLAILLSGVDRGTISKGFTSGKEWGKMESQKFQSCKLEMLSELWRTREIMIGKKHCIYNIIELWNSEENKWGTIIIFIV